MVGGLLKTTSTVAILAAAGLLVGGVTMTPTTARAADLGGDCCADLEERVADLEATTVKKGNRKVKLTITGRVAATMTYWMENSTGPVNLPNNGPFDHKSDLYFGDVSGNGPQIILKGEGKISSDLTAGYYMELSVGAFGGTHGALPDDPVSGNTQVSHQAAGTIDPANTYVYLTSKSLGTLQLGKIDNAGDQYVSSFNGAWMGGYTEGRAGKSFLIRSNDGTLTDQTYGDFLSRLNPGGESGLRYISPVLGGFSINASVHGDDQFGVGANYAGTFSTVSVKAGVGYAAFSRVDGVIDGNNFVDPKMLGLSAGIKESTSGLFLEGAWSKRTENVDPANNNVDAVDATNMFISGGWAKNVSGAGDTTLYVTYDRTDNNVEGINRKDLSAHSLAVGLDQKIDAAASHVFLTYENTNLDKVNVSAIDNDATSPESVSTISAGMSIEF